MTSNLILCNNTMNLEVTIEAKALGRVSHLMIRGIHGALLSLERIYNSKKDHT